MIQLFIYNIVHLPLCQGYNNVAREEKLYLHTLGNHLFIFPASRLLRNKNIDQSGRNMTRIERVQV
jgi:hypothetical protein